MSTGRMSDHKRARDTAGKVYLGWNGVGIESARRLDEDHEACFGCLGSLIMVRLSVPLNA